MDRTRGDVSARCDSEAANVLGLNMEAYSEVGTGEMDHVLTSTDASNDLGQLDF